MQKQVNSSSLSRKKLVYVHVRVYVGRVCLLQRLRAEEVNHFWHHRLPGQTVLLSSTAESIHLHALDIGTCLDGIWVWHKVWQS